MDCSLPGSSVHGILQARIFEWVAMPSSGEIFPTQDGTHVSYNSCISRQVLFKGFLCGSAGKESACSAGDLGSIPGLGRFHQRSNSYLIQYSCLENPMHRGASQATIHGVAKSQTWLSNFHSHSLISTYLHYHEVYYHMRENTLKVQIKWGQTFFQEKIPLVVSMVSWVFDIQNCFRGLSFLERRGLSRSEVEGF